MVMFKMRDSVPSARYSSICNVLRLWRISLIPTFVIVDTAVRVRYAGCLIDIVLYSFYWSVSTISFYILSTGAFTGGVSVGVFTVQEHNR